MHVCILASSDRAVVRATVPCAADHKGAELSCVVTVEGAEVQVTTSGHDGKDPNGACLGDLTAMCESVPLAEGSYTVSYEDETYSVTIPNEDASMCESSSE